MKSIKFSHVYAKMPPNPHPSVLLEAFEVEHDDLCSGFVEYDTRIVDGGNYPLSKGKLLVLLLLTEGGQLWTTLRKCSPEKRDYYRSMRGKVFEIDITEANQPLNTYL